MTVILLKFCFVSRELKRWIIDEACKKFRTDDLFYSEQEKVIPDIVVPIFLEKPGISPTYIRWLTGRGRLTYELSILVVTFHLPNIPVQTKREKTFRSSPQQQQQLQTNPETNLNKQKIIFHNINYQLRYKRCFS